MEKEGWPTYQDIAVSHWSSGLNLFNYWRDNGVRPRLSYVNYKWKSPPASIDYPSWRKVFAGAMFADAGLTFFDQPGSGGLRNALEPPDGRVVPLTTYEVFDEIDGGTAQVRNWMGLPLAAATHLGETSRDLLHGQGSTWPDAFLARFVAAPLRLVRDTSTGTPQLLVTWPSPPDTAELGQSMELTLPNVSVPGPDVLVSVNLSMDSFVNYPAALGRGFSVTVQPSGNPAEAVTETAWAKATFIHDTFYFRNVAPISGFVDVIFRAEGHTPIRLRNLRIRSAADAVVREFEHAVVFANPSPRPYTFDLASLFPTDVLTRLQGSPDQDPVVNDGSRLGATLTLPANDALVVYRS